MSIWTKIKFGIGAAVSLSLVVMHALLRRSNAQRDKAQSERDTAKRSHRATQKKSDGDASIRKAGANARQEAAQAAEERNEQSVEERRSSGGNFGDHSRLRK